MSKSRYLSFLAVFLMCSCAEMNGLEISADDSSVVRMGEDKDLCFGTPYIEVIYPQTIDGSEHNETSLLVEKDEAVVFHAQLARFAFLGGSYFCLEEEFLAGTGISVSYGEISCHGPRHVLSVNDIQSLLTLEVMQLKRVSSENSCED